MEGLKVDMVIVADDVAIDGGVAGRRGLSGTIFVHKVGESSTYNSQCELHTTLAAAYIRWLVVETQLRRAKVESLETRCTDERKWQRKRCKVHGIRGPCNHLGYASKLSKVVTIATRGACYSVPFSSTFHRTS